MNKKTFCFVSVFVLSAMLVLGSTVAYAQQTPGQIVKFGPGSPPPLQDSVITEDPVSRNVGIGTIFGTGAPGAQLHVDGTVRIDDGGFSQSSVGNFDVDAPFVPGGRLRILENGNVGIGTGSPDLPLQVSKPGPYGKPAVGVRDLDASAGGWLYLHAFEGAGVGPAVIWGDGRVPLRFGIEPTSVGGGFAEFMRIQPNGNVGIGTTTPGGKLDIAQTSTGEFLSLSRSDLAAENLKIRGIPVSGQGTGFMFITQEFTGAGYNPRLSLFLSPDGNVGIGTLGSSAKLSVEGAIRAEGKVTGIGGFNGQCTNGFGAVFHPVICNQDVAETFASLEATEPGDLVVLVNQQASTPTVRKSTRPYEGVLVGAVSTNPGLVFDNGETHLAGDNSKLITPEKTVVGLVGRVPVKVSIENGPIAVGDPLTSSSTPGVAMKASRASQIIGYAMEKADQKGKILVHLQPGYYIPPKQLAQLSEMDELKAQVSKLEGLLKTVLAQRPEESASDYVLTSGR